MLKETEGYVSGQDICEKLQVSRTAVWKAIRQLGEEGYEIEAVRNRGYHLKMAGDILSYEEIASSLETRWAGKNLLYFDEVDSTNNVIKREAENGAPHGTLAVADYQSGGKGRRGRVWKSPHGVGIWMSILLRPELTPSSAPMMTLPAAMAVAEGIRAACGLDTKIKWPNDVVVNGKKVCGILTEAFSCGGGTAVVVGIGINVNTAAFPKELQDRVTLVVPTIVEALDAEESEDLIGQRDVRAQAHRRRPVRALRQSRPELVLVVGIQLRPARLHRHTSDDQPAVGLTHVAFALFVPALELAVPRHGVGLHRP